LLVAVLSEYILIYGYVKILAKEDILTQFALVKIIAVLFLIIPSILFFGTELTNKKNNWTYFWVRCNLFIKLHRPKRKMRQKHNYRLYILYLCFK